MKTLPLLLIAGAYIPQLAQAAHAPHDAGYWAQLLSNIATVLTVMYAMGRWGKRQKDEIATKREIYREMVAIFQQLSPPGKPNIIERVEVLEAGIEEIKEEIKEIRLIVHPETVTPRPHHDDPVVTP